MFSLLVRMFNWKTLGGAAGISEPQDYGRGLLGREECWFALVVLCLGCCGVRWSDHGMLFAKGAKQESSELNLAR